MILYQDNDIKYTQLYRFSNGEHYKEIQEDLENLKVLGVHIESITCDGKRSTLKAIKKVYPEIIIQRCLVHVYRMVHIWLKEKPKTIAALELKQVINLLSLVNTHNDRIAFIAAFNKWYEKHNAFINEKAINELTSRWWYRHKNLRRAAIVIRKAIPNLFHFLDNQAIPKSTNALESFFGHLKDSLSIHRGLSYANRKNFIKWYLHFRNHAR